jgi:hypothetical protein
LIGEIKRRERDREEDAVDEHPERWTIRNKNCMEVSGAMVMAGEFDIHWVLAKVLTVDIVPRENRPEVGKPGGL